MLINFTCVCCRLSIAFNGFENPIFHYHVRIACKKWNLVNPVIAHLKPF